MLVLAIAGAGAAGAIARGVIDEIVQRQLDETSTAATLAINVSGSFVLGIVTGLALYHGLASDTKTIVGTGFCGGFTTFSTFAYQVTLLRNRRYVLTSLVFPAAAAAFGLALAAL